MPELDGETLSASSAALSPASAASKVAFLPSIDCMPFARFCALAIRSAKNPKMTTQNSKTYGRMKPRRRPPVEVARKRTRRLVSRIRIALHICCVGCSSVRCGAAKANGHVVTGDVYQCLDIVDRLRHCLGVR